jgi:putative Mg2+ transporter-C (MgtC) family protein
MNFYQEMAMFLPIAFKVLIATICGAIVGYERELKNKSAGLRTIILICVGSCLFTVASFVAAKYTGDPTRILSTIVTGIGFLGGGVIMQHEDKLVGITTAAFIWVVSAIGILCGLGMVMPPIILTLGLVGMSTFLAKYERKIRKDDRD